MATRNTILHGFEDYTIIGLGNRLINSSVSWGPFVWLARVNETWYIDKNNRKITTLEDAGINTDNASLLDTAQKLYIHPNCSISRTLVSSKYKKTLYPAFADAIVIPDTSNSYIRHHYPRLVFINEEAKMLFVIESTSNFDTSKTDIKLKDILVNPYAPIETGWWHNCKDITEEVHEAEFLYYGEILAIPNKSTYIVDILSETLPVDKLVSEESVLKSLTSEENKPTLENMISLSDLLDSKDDASVTAGLKALAMMDYSHYINSVRYILYRTNLNWIYNKATKSTAVKFMLNKIYPSNYRRDSRWETYEGTITPEDYELFVALKKYYNNMDDSEILGHLKTMAFMTVKDGMLVPNYAA